MSFHLHKPRKFYDLFQSDFWAIKSSAFRGDVAGGSCHLQPFSNILHQ